MSSRGDDKDRGADNRTAKVTEELAEGQLQSQERYGQTMMVILVTVHMMTMATMTMMMIVMVMMMRVEHRW